MTYEHLESKIKKHRLFISEKRSQMRNMHYVKGSKRNLRLMQLDNAVTQLTKDLVRIAMLG